MHYIRKAVAATADEKLFLLTFQAEILRIKVKRMHLKDAILLGKLTACLFSCLRYSDKN